MYADLAGVSTYYERAATGAPVLLVHPFGSSSLGWRRVVGALGGECDVIALDWGGHGRSEKRINCCTLPSLVETVAELATRHWDRPACVVGVAAGAVIALQTALAHPGVVSSLLLAAGCAAVEPAVGERISQRADLVNVMGMRAAVDASVRATFSPTFRATHPDLISEYRGEFLGTDPHTYSESLRMLVDFDVTARLAEIDMPVKLLVGEQDQYFPPAASVTLAKALPNATLDVIAGAGHFLHLEMPQVVATHVLELVRLHSIA